jgi:hypothetical protein
MRQNDNEHDQTCCQNDFPATSSSESEQEEDKNLRIIDEYGTEVCFDKISQRSLSPVQRAKIAKGKVIMRQKKVKKSAAQIAQEEADELERKRQELIEEEQRKE